MRIKRIAGLTLAGAAAVAAVGIATAAYADDPASEKTVRIVTENNGNVFGGTADVSEDCPEKAGAETPAEAGL
ncbi:hypothetical protein [Plantactinospora mayteni]|nr:hypothetical protein [Plantactinospora mayteni]